MPRISIVVVVTAGALFCFSLVGSCVGGLVLKPAPQPTTLLPSIIPRRAALWQGSSVIAASLVVTATSAPCVSAAAVEATITADTTTSPTETINTLLSRLHDIPTFCIVSSSPEGAAYMAFKQDQAMAVGYAFITFQGALAVLGDAQRNAKEKGYADVWEGATVTTIPLDIAVRLSLKKRQRTSQKAQVLDTLLMVIPGAVRTNALIVLVFGFFVFARY